MSPATDHLRAKALLALEEATQECRYGQVPRSFAIRFALAYLWSLAPTSREPFDEFWRALSAADMWRFSSADRALSGIYQHIGATFGCVGRDRRHSLAIDLLSKSAAHFAVDL